TPDRDRHDRRRSPRPRRLRRCTRWQNRRPNDRRTGDGRVVNRRRECCPCPLRALRSAANRFDSCGPAAREGSMVSETSAAGEPGELRRSLGVADAVVIGLGAMLGAGIFAALAPAARAAGSGLLLGLAVAAVVAYCNATSSARLAARYPASGGTYVYGRERLGEFWGYLAGWCFVVGKTA